MPHNHKTKIVDWILDEAHDFIPSLYGCTECDETFVDLPVDEVTNSEPTEFALKIRTLQFSTGDANSASGMASKKWDAENQAYEDAVRQGIEPSGVSMYDIEASLKASEILGAPYNAETMIAPEKIKPAHVDFMKATGGI